jgi:hypothetical protein
MRILNHRFFLAVCVWEICVIPPLSIEAAFRPHIWSKALFAWVAIVTICGFAIVSLVALLSRHFGKLGGAISGFLCGVSPSAVILAWVILTAPGFEASAGWAGIAYLFVLPTSIAGTIAGIICSGQNRASA